MRTLVWSSSFVRALRRRVRRRPGLRDEVEKTLRQLAEDAFHPSLYSQSSRGSYLGRGLAVWVTTFGLSSSSFGIQSPARRKSCC